jgi:hypothetical protein
MPPDLESAESIQIINKTINAITLITCKMGYISSDNLSLPYFQCEAYNQTIGKWSNIIHSCLGLYRLRKFENKHLLFMK